MEYLHPLPERLKVQAASFQEFANGAAQCHARLLDGTVCRGLLINGEAILAVREQAVLPFPVESIEKLFQDGDDLRPVSRGGWQFFDDWGTDAISSHSP